MTIDAPNPLLPMDVSGDVLECHQEVQCLPFPQISRTVALDAPILLWRERRPLPTTIFLLPAT